MKVAIWTVFLDDENTQVGFVQMSSLILKLKMTRKPEYMFFSKLVEDPKLIPFIELAEAGTKYNKPASQILR